MHSTIELSLFSLLTQQRFAALAFLVVASLSPPVFAEEPRTDFKTIPGSQEFFEKAVQDSEGKQWKPIFNQRDLEGWKVVLAGTPVGEDPEKIFQVVDGVVHVYRDTPAGKKMPFGVILSNAAYSHYRFRFDYKWGEKKFAPRENLIRDAGLLFHVVGPEKIWPMSVECQVQENDVGDNYLVYTGCDTPVDASGRKFQDASQGGKWKSFYSKGGVTRVIKSETLEHDGWNTVEVIVRGDAAIYLVNGKINNYVVNMRAPIGPKGEMVPLTSGKLALQCEGAELFYRNMEVLELDSKESVSAAPAPEGFSNESISPVPPRSPQASLESWRVREGFRIELIAAEPLVRDPVAIDWGNDGKLWVVEMADYPSGMDGKGKPGGRVRFLEQSRPGGKFDRSTLFLEGLNFPTGIVSWRKGVIVTAAPEIFYAEDTDGDGKCDVRKVLFKGFHEGNQQLRVNGLRWGMDGWIYCASGSHVSGYGGGSKIHSTLTGETTALGSRDFRFHPETGEIVLLSGPSQFGRNQDERGNWFGVQNSYPLWHYVLEDRYLRRNPYYVPPDPRQLLTESNPVVFPAAEISAQPNPHTKVGRFTSACSGMVYQDQLLSLGTADAHAFTCEPVHNLVQHNLLRKSGPTFQMTSDVQAGQVDFLASTDPWCRPVMVRTGPDGALWVVDMYRYIIEHPHWVPEAVQKELEPLLRLGDARGRIYRVVPENGRLHDGVDVESLHLNELVRLLEHSNDHVRSAAQRKIAELKDPESGRKVAEFYSVTRSVPGKLYASYLLNQLAACTSEHVLKMLHDDDADVRRHGLILMEQLASPSSDVLTQLANMLDDANESVQLQLALTLGELKYPVAGQLLATIWKNEPQNRFMEAALFSSLNDKNVVDVFSVAVTMPLITAVQVNRYRMLVAQAMSLGATDRVLASLESNAEPDPGLIRAMTTLNAVYGHSDGGKAVQKIAVARLNEIHDASRKLLTSGSAAAAWQKDLAVRLLFGRPDQKDQDRELVSELLLGAKPSGIQSAVIRHLGTQRDEELGKLMFIGWKNYLPTTQDVVLEVLAARPAWHHLLLNFIDGGVVQPATVSLEMQERLIRAKNSKVAEQLKERFQRQSLAPESLSKWISSVSTLQADAHRGEAVFKKHCADCHQFNGHGVRVGPNLASMTSRTSEALIDAIVFPNKAVEPRYINYSIAMVDGRVISGVIEQEAENSITLMKAKGERTSVLQSEIDELSSTGKSLMPDGFERTLQPQEMADLIRYLQQPELN